MSEWLASLSDLQHMAAGTAYLVLFVLVFVETGIPLGFFLPGDSVLFTAGLLAAHPGSPLNLWVLVVGVFLAAVAGDSTGFTLGRHLGRPWLLRSAGRARKQVGRAERLYGRYGWGAVVIARFIPWVRSITPSLAGIAAMSYRRFLTANLVGAACWGAGLVLLGYAGYFVPWVKWAAYAAAISAILFSIIVPIVDWRRGKFAASIETA